MVSVTYMMTDLFVKKINTNFSYRYRGFLHQIVSSGQGQRI